MSLALNQSLNLTPEEEAMQSFYSPDIYVSPNVAPIVNPAPAPKGIWDAITGSISDLISSVPKIVTARMTNAPPVRSYPQPMYYPKPMQQGGINFSDPKTLAIIGIGGYFLIKLFSKRTRR